MPETFKCPACSAPLDYEGNMMQKCKFCGSNVIVPAGVMRSSPAFGGVGSLDFGDLSALTGKALKLAEIRGLISQGNKIEAIKVFRETFGTGLREAKDAVDAMERGESVDISGMRVQPARSNFGSPAVSSRVVKTFGLAVGGWILAGLVFSGVVFFAVMAFVLFGIKKSESTSVSTPKPTRATPAPMANPNTKEEGPSIATELARFGGEGIGAGKFKDNRTVAVAPDGRVFSSDYSGGRIQVFDASGNFSTQITGDTSRSVDALAFDRKGNLIVKQGYDIFRYDPASGEKLTTTRINSATDIALSLDGRIYATARRTGIHVIAPGGGIERTITLPKELNLDYPDQIVIDGAGSLFVLDDRTSAVFKLSPEGKLLNRFGGLVRRSSGEAPRGTFSSRPEDMAVDSQGRLYVAETDRVSVFDNDGNYLNSFPVKQTFAIAIDDKDEVLTASRPFVVRYSVKF
jgi:sugar lactone lactonase YvrE